jgi:hypothetical protein
VKGAPNCYDCEHRREIPGDCHSECVNQYANVAGDPGGTAKGWFLWPWNFDPTWLLKCDGFSAKVKP